MSALANNANRASVASSLSRNQVRGFWASWGGWTLDGMDSFIYALVLVPSLRDLLPRSGIAATKANIGYYGSLLFALFLVGWGMAFLCLVPFGLADRGLSGFWFWDCGCRRMAFENNTS